MSLYPDARFLTSANRPIQFVGDDGAEVAFAGRSNSGKSTAINTIVSRRQLARVSKTPGRTRLVNFFHLAPGERLVDLPGYGFARAPHGARESWRELLEAYFETRRSLCGLFVTVDVRRTLGKLDLQMLDWTRVLGHPVHVLLTKTDKLGRGPASRALASARKACGPATTVQLFSARTGEGVADARERLRELLAARRCR